MILIALGTNLKGGYASCEAVLDAALEALEAQRVKLLARSPIYQTPPIGPPGQGDYLNMVIRVGTVLPPRPLLKILHKIEFEMGRERRVRWGARIIDLDLIDYRGQQHRFAPILPHPRLHQRGFVLRPLHDIAPGWRHPVSQRSVQQLLQALPANMRIGVRRLTPIS